MPWLVLVLLAIGGYAFGSINFAILFGKYFFNTDVRNHGSGNAGATNVLRTLGKGAALAVVVMDLLKGVIAFFTGYLIAYFMGYDSMIFPYAAGFAAVAGHNFPMYFNFKGGKGILTSLALITCADWQTGLIGLLIGIVLIAATRYVSLGSVMGSLYVMAAVLIFPKPIETVLFIEALGLLAVYMHRQNIMRLFNGQENKINFKKSDK